jgi:four helix bundle protein
MPNSSNKEFDLEKRTTEFAKSVIRLCRKLPKDSINNRITSQLAGCSGSAGANYREANDALGKKDFILRLKIARKEAKETMYWLKLLAETEGDKVVKIRSLYQESKEFVLIFSAILKH